MTLSDHISKIQKTLDALAKEPESERLIRVVAHLEDAQYWLANEKVARMAARQNEKTARAEEQKNS